MWRDNADRLQRAPGMGPVCARPLVWDLPALGTLTRQQIAALVGVAPLQCARGTLRGRRMMWGGRAHVRTVLSMGTRVATRDTPRRKALYARLRAAGKVKKVALTACIHQFLTILNARLKHRMPWQSQEVQGSKNRRGPLTTKTVAPLLRRCDFRQQECRIEAYSTASWCVIWVTAPLVAV